MRMTDAYPTADRVDAVLEIPVPFARAGTWHAEIRARLVDDNGDWYFEVGYNTGIAENRIGTFPAAWVRRPGLTDLDGIVPPDVLERMKTDGAEPPRLREPKCTPSWSPAGAPMARPGHKRSGRPGHSTHQSGPPTPALAAPTRVVRVGHHVQPQPVPPPHRQKRRLV